MSAYISYIILDEQFKYTGGGFSRVENAGSTATVKFKDHTDLNNIPVTKNGYVYVYVSNENNVPVYFDNLQVSHVRGPLLEETHYYPFGLTMHSISSKAAGGVENKYKFNDGTELQEGEFNDGSGLELYDAVNRGYAPQLGRFWQVDELAEGNFEWTPYKMAGSIRVIIGLFLSDWCK